MKIFFSTLFDKTTYPQNIFLQDGVAIGTSHMGPMALIDFLELHLGLPNSCTNDIERIFNYRKNLHKKAKESFYEKSLATNDLEVATKLLQWRDELKTAGWDFKDDKNCPSRLKDIANVEGNIGVGIAERFRIIINVLNAKPWLPITEIIVHEPLDLLPAHISNLFLLLTNSGVSIKYRETDTIRSSNSDLDTLQSFVLNNNSQAKTKVKADGSVQVLRFNNLLSAGKGLSALIANDPGFKPVIINESSNISLALSLRENGEPSTGQSMQSASHTDLQLLAIIPVWLWKPYNPQQVLDFFLSPLNIFSKGLSARWLDLFTENPGVSFDAWIKELDEFTQKYHAEKDKEKYTDRLNFILNIGKDHDELIAVETVIDYYNYFYQNFNARCALTQEEELRSRLQRLCNSFKEFIDVLKITPEKELNLFDLQKLLQLILKPVSIKPFEKEAGSLDEISAPGLLAGNCDDVLWMGFSSTQTAGTLWNEWTPEELQWLKEKNVFIDTAEHRAKKDAWFLTQWLRFVKKRLILVVPAVVEGEAAQPHPFQPFLQACFSELHNITINVERPDEMSLIGNKKSFTESIKTDLIPQFPVYWQVRGNLFTQREEESFSSLENLMKYPYRWVMSYQAKLYRGRTLALPNNFMFYGTLSHKIFQHLLVMPEVLTMKGKELQKLYSETTEKFIEQKGLILNIQGEEGNLKIFHEYLFSKFFTLLRHVKENNWTVEGCEIKRSGNIGAEKVGGSCDLLLTRMKNNKTETAVVDLKFAAQSKYRKLMEDGEDLQLAIYSRIFHPTARTCPTSYFIITEGLLFTTCRDAFTNGIILRQDADYIDTYTSVLQKIEKTIHYRRKELDSGHIEVGENVGIDELEIFSPDMKDSFIIPKQEKKVKCLSTYNDYVTFIDTE